MKKKVKDLDRPTTKTGLRNELADFADKADELFKPLCEWHFLSGPFPDNINGAALLKILESCFSDGGINEWRAMISLENYRDHRGENREPYIDLKMQKLSKLFLTIARISSQKQATDAVMVFTWLAEAVGVSGKAMENDTEDRSLLSRSYALEGLDKVLDLYLEAFYKLPVTEKKSMIWFLDNQQVGQNTGDGQQRVIRRNPGKIKVLFI